MSYNEAVAKLRWYQLRAMESPLDSEERKIWISIKRDLEALIRRMTTAGTVVTQTQN